MKIVNLENFIYLFISIKNWKQKVFDEIDKIVEIGVGIFYKMV